MTTQPLSYRYPQLAKEALLTAKLGAEPRNRMWAKVVDVVILYTLSLIAGKIFSIAYFVAPVLFFSVIDGLGQGQSPGKWLLGLHTIQIPRGDRVQLWAGLLRNLPFIALLWISFLHGSLATSILWIFCLAWLALETYFIYSIQTGLRMGDVISQSRVFDYKDEHTKFIEQFLRDDQFRAE